MKRRYPAKLFYWGILMDFLFHFIYLSVPGVILCIIGIWSKICLWIGLGVLCLDLILTVVEQLRIRKAALTPSDNLDFNQMMEALTGPGGLEAFGEVLDEKIKKAPPAELTEEEKGLPER